MKELLPCPFCGGTNIGEDYVETYSLDSSYFIFGCYDCGARFEEGTEKEWNHRVTLPSKKEERKERVIAQLRRALTLAEGFLLNKGYRDNDPLVLGAVKEALLAEQAYRKKEAKRD